jgi:hypothetical protein
VAPEIATPSRFQTRVIASVAVTLLVNTCWAIAFPEIVFIEILGATGKANLYTLDELCAKYMSPADMYATLPSPLNTAEVISKPGFTWVVQLVPPSTDM